MQLQTIPVENSNGFTIVGKSKFLSTIQKIHQQLTRAFPGIKFGLTYIDTSKPKVVKYSGTDETLIQFAKKNACKIGVGSIFILCLESDFPVSVMETIKGVDNLLEIYCATPNPVALIVADSDRGRNLMGLADDYSSSSVKKRALMSKTFN